MNQKMNLLILLSVILVSNLLSMHYFTMPKLSNAEVAPKIFVEDIPDAQNLLYRFWDKCVQKKGLIEDSEEYIKKLFYAQQLGIPSDAETWSLSNLLSSLYSFSDPKTDNTKIITEDFPDVQYMLYFLWKKRMKKQGNNVDSKAFKRTLFYAEQLATQNINLNFQPVGLKALEELESMKKIEEATKNRGKSKTK